MRVSASAAKLLRSSATLKAANYGTCPWRRKDPVEFLFKYISKCNIETVDLGVPVIAMHAPYEVIAKVDLYEAYRAFSAFNKFD